MGFKNLLKKSIDKLNNIAVVSSSPTPIKQNQPKLIKQVDFKAAGVTFEDRQKVFEQFIKDAKKENEFEPYNGMTKQEIIEANEYIYEANYVSVNTLRLEPVKIKRENAIELYIKDFYKRKEYLIGYVEKAQIKEVFEFLEILQNHPEYKLEVDAYIIGGKVKYSKDDESKEIIEDTLNYGLDVTLKIYDK